jgi:hypothetical protein
MFFKVPHGKGWGRMTIPSNGGFAPRCTTEDTIAKLLSFAVFAVPTRLALLNPESELMKSALS